MTAPLLGNRVAEIWTGTGTGTVTPGGALTGGYVAWGDAFAVGAVVRYVIAHRGLTEFEVGVGTIGAGGTLARTTVVESSNADALVSFSAGEKDVFCAIDAVSLMGIGIQRLDVEITTPLLAIGDVYEATVTDFGRLFRLLKFTADNGLWVRLYGSAADRTADARTDPTVAVTTEAVLAEAVLYGATLTADAPAGVHGIGVFMDNAESPQLGRLFVRITRLDESGGTTPPDLAIIEADFVEVSQANLSAHTISDPGATGGTRFEHVNEGTQPGDWRVNPSGSPSGAYRHAMNGGSAADVARFNAAIADDNIDILTPIYRASIESVVCDAGVALLVPDEAIATWDGTDYLRVVVAASNEDENVPLELQYVVGIGPYVTVDIATVNIGDFLVSTEHTLRVRIEGWRVRAWWDEVLVIDVDLATVAAMDPYRAGLRDGFHDRVGIYGLQDNQAARLTHRSYLVTDVTTGLSTEMLSLQALGDRLAA